MANKDRATAEAIFECAVRLRTDRRYAEALGMVRNVFGGAAPALAPKLLRRAYSLALTCAVKLKNWIEVEALARNAILCFPEWAEYQRRLGEALLRQERFPEAEVALQAAMDLNPVEQDAPLLLELCRSRIKPQPLRARIAPWPGHNAIRDDPQRLIRRYVLGRKRGAAIVEPDSVFMTLGSCFAQHLGQRLREIGRKVNSEEIGEDVNSTYANRYLLDWVEHGPRDSVTEAINAAYGPLMREQMRKKIAESDVFVITLGAAPSFFRKDSGDFALVISKATYAREHLFDNHLMRTTSVAENTDNILRIVDSITRLAQRTPKFVLTVSPVPLGGTTELDSAVVADCVSKSTLRVAAHEVCAGSQGNHIVYWPSFEIVRWLAPYFGCDRGPVFGAEDGNSRHVSKWLVQLIIDLFIEHHSTNAAEAAEALAKGAPT